MNKEHFFKSQSIWISIGILLVAYFVLHDVVFMSVVKNVQLSMFSESFSYFSSSLMNMPTMLLFLLFTLFFTVNFKKFQWDNFENSKTIKVFVLILAGAIFWEQGFYDYNFYLDSNIVLDKLILITFFALIFYNPVFIFLFLFQSLLIWQSNMSPLGSFHWTDIRPAYEILMLFVAFMIVKRFRDVHTNIFILLAITLHASNYFIPGIAKIEISPNGYEWTFLNNLNNLFISSYVNGWLGFLNEELIMSIAQLLDKTEVLVTVGTMIIQLGALFLLYTKRISIAFFIGFELLHLGIFFASGIFFWAWIIVNLGFIYLVKKLPKESLGFLYSRQSFGVFIVVVLLSPLVYKPVALGWWDVRVNTIYDFYATTSEGEKLKINRNDFSPYDTIFTQNRFYYIDKDKTLSNTYGCINRDEMLYGNFFTTLINYVAKPILGRESSIYTNNSYELYSSIENAKNLNEIKSLLDRYGFHSYDAKKEENLQNFIKTYFQNYNKVEQKHSWYHKLGAPYHIYDLSAKRLQGEEKINKVEVYKTNTWWNKEEAKIVKFGEEKVMEVDIETN
jgi:hypothetical protein